MEGRSIIAIGVGSLLGFFGWKALRDDPEDSTVTPNDRNKLIEDAELPAGAPATLNTFVLRGRMDPDRARRALKKGLDEGDHDADRAATDEMKRFLQENPIRL